MDDQRASDEALGDTLRGLLEGDRVRIVTEDHETEAIVDGKSGGHGPDAAADPVELHLLPDHPDAEADGYVVTVEPDADGRAAVGDLFAEVYDEDSLEYDMESRGRVTAVEVLE